MIVFVGALKSNTIIKQKERLLNGKWYDNDDWEYYGNDRAGDDDGTRKVSMSPVENTGAGPLRPCVRRHAVARHCRLGAA